MTHSAENDAPRHDYLGWQDGSCACSCGRRFDTVQSFDAHVIPPEARQS